MSERYSRLFALPEDLYCVGSPVVIAAGALLKDNQTGKVIGQLKLRSISPKAIKAVKVKLNLFDTAGNPIGDSVEHTYLDLSARRKEEFGQKSPVAVAESQTRSYQASVSEVVFEDQSVWTANECPWEPLAKPVALSITDPELLKQYQMYYGTGAKYEAKEEKDLWHCTCGALNHEGENCHVCGHSLFELQTVDMEKLTAEKDARLAEEAHKAAEEQAAAESQKKKITKILAIVIPAVCAVVAIILLATRVIIPNSKYNNAVKLMDAGSYEEAIVAFEAMAGYKDSVQKIGDCELAIKYDDAFALMDAGRYVEAIVAFEAMDDYKDSDKQIQLAKEAAYVEAIALMEAGEDKQAYDTFKAIGNYKDSAEKCEECSKMYVLLSESTKYYETIYEYSHGKLVKETATNTTSNSAFVVFGHLYLNVGDRASQEYKYDNNGNIIELMSYVHGKAENTRTYEYDSNGYLVKEVYDNQFGDTYIYEYDDLGNMTAKLCYANVSEMVGNTLYIGNELECKTRHYYEYDKHNNLIQENIWSLQSGDSSITYTNEYDSNGRLVKQSSSSSNGDVTTLEYVYDGKGNLISEIKTGSADSYEYHYEYDEFGNVIIFENVNTGFIKRYTYGYINRFQ